ncbi:hypothetical protein Enr13x_05250 [Stieleria neptunia]|uniref:Uncharacterized protein n=1 Tax=Stieleria neptunia TaxID=2527979 RepID=A0A518HIS4_9BACT|nr:hypothetical protein [Stieleria neptunia]QDV40690.1 hypothetical protein Enr13x_05250 [Stieleria neptunia]
MSENVSTSGTEKPTAAYWGWRRIIAFVLIQLSWTAYLLGAGSFGALYALGSLLGGANREVNVITGISLMLVLYAIGAMLIAAVLLAAVALIFSRKTLYLGIAYVPTAIYAYHVLSV